MYEVEFLPVGQAGRHGDAIALRFIDPGGALRHAIIDAGFAENGDALVEHFDRYYGTRAVDIAILTHPDGDHIGGMGTVVRDLDVGALWVHRLRDRGGGALPAADAVDELIEVAEEQGTEIYEPFAGSNTFDGALQILGPTEDYYAELVTAQLEEAGERAARRAPSVLEAARQIGQRFLANLPVEIPFDDAGGTNPRNNSSVVTLLAVDGRRMLLTADAGVPALERALDWGDYFGLNPSEPDFVQMPHHGSRHNGSSALLDRMLGPTGQPQTFTSFVNVGPGAVKHPSPRIANAFMRRGRRVCQTAGQTIRYHNDAPHRDGWMPLTPLEPLDESIEDD